MTLKLRRLIWNDGFPSIGREDYKVIEERGERIGRMYRADAIGGGDVWRWSGYGLATYDKPPAGLEPTSEKAMASFKARSEATRARRLRHVWPFWTTFNRPASSACCEIEFEILFL